MLNSPCPATCCSPFRSLTIPPEILPCRPSRQGSRQRTRVVSAVPWIRASVTGGMALYFMAALAWALSQGWWSSLPFMLLFTAGFTGVSLSLWLEGQRAVESAEMGALPATK